MVWKTIHCEEIFKIPITNGVAKEVSVPLILSVLSNMIFPYFQQRYRFLS